MGAIVPPVKWAGGFPAFFVALGMIGIITGVVGSVAELLGYVVGLKPAITAITLVALGTSLPDTFASMTAARSSEYADSAIGNVTGSNSVNVFLGLGLPWAIASTYWASKELRNGQIQNYPVPKGAVAFSVFVFLVVAVICFIILIARRIIIGGELGGPKNSRYVSAGILLGLWCTYITISILYAENIIF